MLFAAIIGGYIQLDQQYLSEASEKQLSWFREKDPSLMKYGTYSNLYSVPQHARDIEKILGLD